MGVLFGGGLVGRYLEAHPQENINIFVAIIVAACFICMVAGYLIGSINFATIISKKEYGSDVRDSGSGNAGTTNMLRTYGKKAAALTLLGDFMKGAVAVLIGYLIIGLPDVRIMNGTEVQGVFSIGAYLSGLFCIIGHTFPVFFKFRGGKGVAALGGVLIMLSPVVFLPTFAVFAILLFGTKYMSLASIIAVMIYPIFLNRIEGPGYSNIFALLIAVIIVVNHRANIKRLLAHEEPKISFGKKKQ